MSSEYDTVGHCFELTKTTPPRHQQEESKVAKREYLGYTFSQILSHHNTPDAWWFDAQIAQHEKHENESAIKVLVPSGTIAN